MSDYSKRTQLRLEEQKQTMIQYLHLRVEMEDWHGVMDAAADIREIEAKISVLKKVGRT